MSPGCAELPVAAAPGGWRGYSPRSRGNPPRLVVAALAPWCWEGAVLSGRHRHRGCGRREQAGSGGKVCVGVLEVGAIPVHSDPPQVCRAPRTGLPGPFLFPGHFLWNLGSLVLCSQLDPWHLFGDKV